MSKIPKISDAAEAHMTEVFNNNPDGFTVSPWSNEYTCFDSFERGAHWVLKLVIEKVEKMVGDTETLYKANGLTDAGEGGMRMAMLLLKQIKELGEE